MRNFFYYHHVTVQVSRARVSLLCLQFKDILSVEFYTEGGLKSKEASLWELLRKAWLTMVI